MKLSTILPLVLLAGCSSSGSTPTQPDPSQKLTPQEKIEKIQGDPKVPDGLKKIQIDTLNKESGNKS